MVLLFYMKEKTVDGLSYSWKIPNVVDYEGVIPNNTFDLTNSFNSQSSFSIPKYNFT
jgi:hypothetical protein